MSSIDESAVRHVANLARLRVTDEEVTTYAAQLSQILDYAKQLEEVDTTSVEPTAHPLPIKNVLREDEPRPSWPAEQALSNAPDPHAGFFRVPQVLDQEGA